MNLLIAMLQHAKENLRTQLFLKAAKNEQKVTEPGMDSQEKQNTGDNRFNVKDKSFSSLMYTPNYLFLNSVSRY